MNNKTTSVRKIKSAIFDQAYQGRRRVWVQDNKRVVDARTHAGQLQVKTLNTDGWINVECVTID